MIVDKHKKLYTLGTSNRESKDFLEILKTYCIEAVIDVRRFPTSRWEHFKKENLQKILEKEGINYFYLGRELGGYRKEGYEKHIETPLFKEGIQRLEKIATRLTSVFICAEKLPWKCHRRFIADVLQKRGWKVIHIIDRQRTWNPRTSLFLNDT